MSRTTEMILRCLLPIAVALAIAIAPRFSLTTALADQNPANRKVIAITPNAVLRQAPLADSAIIDRYAVAKVYRVRRSEGDWLFVGSGWIEHSNVMDCDQAIRFFNLRGHALDAWELASRCHCHLESHNLDSAIADAMASLKIDPKCASARVGLGRVYLERGDIAAARREFTTALKLGTTDAEALFGRAVSNAEAGNVEDGVRDLSELLKRDPKNQTALANRGAMLVMLGRNRPGIQDLDLAIKLDPRDAVSLKNRGAAWAGEGEYRRAMVDLDSAVALNPNNAGAWANHGIVNHNIGKLRDALSDFDRAIDLCRTDANVYCNRGLTRLAIGGYSRIDKSRQVAQSRGTTPLSASRDSARSQYRLAIADFTAALDLEPTKKIASLAYSGRGNALCRMGRFSDAAADFTSAIDCGDRSGLAYRNRAVAWNEIRQYEKSLADCTEAIRVDPGDLAAHREHAIALLNCRRFKEARQALMAAVSQATSQIAAEDQPINALYFRGEFNRMLGRTRQAVADYSDCLNRNPNQADVVLARGKSLSAAGRLIEALADFDESLKMRPESGALFCRSAVLSALGEWRRAREDAKAGLGSAPGSAIGHAALAAALAGEGEYRAALQEYERALFIEADSATISAGLSMLLATCPEEDVRDGARALRLANRALELSYRPHPYLMMVQAAAYAERGDFDNAVAWQTRAVELLEGAGPERREAELIRNGYREQRPLRSSLRRFAPPFHVFRAD